MSQKLATFCYNLTMKNINNLDRLDFKIRALLHSKKVAHILYNFIWALLERASNHDDSKFTEQEVEGYTKAMLMSKDVKYGSPEYKQMLEEIKPALEHHYANNRHHPEWHKNQIEGMTLIDLIEMLADWQAATTRNKDGDIYSSIDFGIVRYKISPQLKSILINTAKEYFKEDVSS